jgi:hypothetical protein
MGIMMKCGHSANATSEDGSPCCVICVGIHPGAEEIDSSPPSLVGRVARCSYFGKNCKSEVTSDAELAFFKHHPNQPHDEYYCGCFGWS